MKWAFRYFQHLRLYYLFKTRDKHLLLIQDPLYKKSAFNPFKIKPHKMVKHTQKICRQQSTNCLNVFDSFVELALKGLKTTFIYELLMTSRMHYINT